MKKSIIAQILLTIIGIMPLAAQKHSEVTINAGGGVSGLNYRSEAGKSNLDLGGKVGVGFNFFFNDHWGIGTGADIALYRSHFAPADFTGLYYVASDDFNFIYTLSYYTEKQRAVTINVPLMLRFQYDIFYAAAGLSVGIPLATTFNIKEATLSTKGEKITGGLVLPDNDPKLKEYGFGRYTTAANNGVLGLNVQYFASAEVGVKWRLNKLFVLYTGIYADWGVNNISKAATNHIIEYDRDQNYEKTTYTPNSVLTSKLDDKSFTNKLNLAAIGIKVTLAFNSKYLERRPAKVKVIDTLPFEQPEAEPEPESEPAPEVAAPKPIKKPRPVQVPREVTTPVTETVPVELPSVITGKQAPTKPQPSKVAEPAYIAPPAPIEEKQFAQELKKMTDSMAVLPPQSTEAEQFGRELILVTNSVLVRTEIDEELGEENIYELEKPVSGYDLNKVVLPKAAMWEFDEKIAILNKFPHINIVIEGHTCDLGSHLVNYRVAMQRANVIRRYLIQKGINKNRILATVSIAEEEPLVSNSSIKNRKINRRTVLRIVR
jgi:outer membrane protein OmpA-like peptidoglycan-associated protein